MAVGESHGPRLAQKWLRPQGPPGQHEPADPAGLPGVSVSSPNRPCRAPGRIVCAPPIRRQGPGEIAGRQSVEVSSRWAADGELVPLLVSAISRVGVLAAAASGKGGRVQVMSCSCSFEIGGREMLAMINIASHAATGAKSRHGRGHPEPIPGPGLAHPHRDGVPGQELRGRPAYRQMTAPPRARGLDSRPRRWGLDGGATRRAGSDSSESGCSPADRAMGDFLI